MTRRKLHLLSRRSGKRMSAVLAAVLVAFSVIMPAEAYAQEGSPAAGQETEVSDGAGLDGGELSDGADFGGGEASDSVVSAGTAVEAEETDTSGGSRENAGAEVQTASGDHEDAGENAAAEAQTGTWTSRLRNLPRSFRAQP